MESSKHQRTIPLDDPALVTMVQEKGQLVESGRAISTEMEALAAQHDKLAKEVSSIAEQTNKLKRKIFKKVEYAAKKLLGDYEIPITTEIRDGKLVLIVTDALAEFEDSFKDFDKWHEPVPRKKKQLEDK
jgi:hypothetical protein